ncbi:MAG: SUMF1/EgtB/PvdO family nonheme iron enzyme, partial [Caldilineales bacterium]|nr:SUMF1/EgtB/PvdO family nonheme iron enzyme [Caldilineales bacterium]
NQPGQPPSSRLTHDTLAPHVRKRFDESDAPGQRARRILESRKLGWQSGKMGVPLDSTDLNTVENGLAGLRELSQDEGRLISASRKLAERNRRNRLLLLMTLSALFFIVTVIALQATIYPILLMQTARMDGYPVSVGALKIKIEAYEVTNQRYRWCFNAGICSAPSSQLTTYFQSSADHMPITGIDAIQAAVFCDWIQRRLPKVDEWQSIIEFTGVNEKISPEMANLCYENCESSTGKPHEVGSYLDGITGGIYDLIGNVFEWTRTEMNDKSHQGNEWTYAKSAPVPSDLAIVGGSYLSDARGALVASRQSGQPAEYVGVRCVETLELH